MLHRLLLLHIVHDDASMLLLVQPLTVVKLLIYLKHYEVIAISKVVKNRSGMDTESAPCSKIVPQMTLWQSCPEIYPNYNKIPRFYTTHFLRSLYA